jgi:hypothetical protein
LYPYPIELEFDSLERLKSGNTGVEYVHRIDSGLPGPHVWINALTHGNEVCGAIALRALMARGFRPSKGMLTLSFANVAAYQSFNPTTPDRARFVAEDFNRIWSPAKLDEGDVTPERSRARAMRVLADSADFLLDIHSMHDPGPPLLLSGPLEKGLKFARSLQSTATIIADAGHAEGVRLRDYAGFGDATSPKNALLIECGQHFEAKSVAVAQDTVARFLHVLGLDDQASLASWRLADNLAPRALKVTGAYAARSNECSFTQAWRPLEEVESQSQVIGMDNGEPFYAPHDHAVLVMPSLRQLRPGVTIVRFAQAV